MRALAGLLAVFLAFPVTASSQCRAESRDVLVPLVELYTSEGCDSCPAADRWLSQAFPFDRPHAASILAFHVDYWDRLGWVDRFANAAYTARQYAAMRANRAGFVYTPQVLLQGRDYTGWRRGDARRAIASAGSNPPRAHLAVAAESGADWVDATLDVALTGSADRTVVVGLAYTDSRLTSQVRAGENRGETLVHDHVVRHLEVRPLRETSSRQRFSVPRPAEAGRHPRLVAFVQDERSGDVLQTLAMPLSGCR